jgi:hypothetical protein
LFNESISFVGVKPLYDSICHNSTLLSNYFQNLRLEDAIMRMGLFLQKKIALPIEDRALLNS